MWVLTRTTLEADPTSRKKSHLLMQVALFYIDCRDLSESDKSKCKGFEQLGG